MEINENSANRAAVVGDFSGRATDLPIEAAQDDVAKRVFFGSSHGLPGYLDHYKPRIDITLSLPVVEGGKVSLQDRAIHLPFGGAMRRGARPTDQIAALLASAAPLAIAIDICDAENPEDHPALVAGLVADGLATLLEQKGPFSELDLATKDGVTEARKVLSNHSPKSTLAAPAKREILPDREPLMLPALTSNDAVPALRRAPGIAADITVVDLARLREQGISHALDVIEASGENWRTTARDARALITNTLMEAVETVTEKMQPLLKVWLSLAQTVRSAAQHCDLPVATLDLAGKDLLIPGDARTPMAGEDGLWFQEELFNAVVTPMTAVDLSTSASMVLLAEPVSSLSELETVGRYAKDARTMVFASLDPETLEGLRTCLERDAFDKDDEVWKRYVSVYAPSVQINGPDGTDIKISLPAAAAVVARLIEVKTEPAGPDEEVGEYARALVGARTPVLVNGSSMPGAIPSIIIDDTALHQRMAKGLVTLLYHSDRLGTFASDAETLYRSSQPADAIYGVSTATMLTNYLTRTIAHHMSIHYVGRAGTADSAKALEDEIRGLFKALDNGTKGSSRKILVADQTEVSVDLVDNGRRLNVKLKVGMPNILVPNQAPDVTAQVAEYDLPFDKTDARWLLSA